MTRTSGVVATAAVAGAGFAAIGLGSRAFVVPGAAVEAEAPVVSTGARFLGQQSSAAPGNAAPWGVGGALAAAGLCAAAVRTSMTSRSSSKSSKASLVSISSSLPAVEPTVREHLIACQAAGEVDVPTVEEADAQMNQLESIARQALGTAAAVAVFTSSMGEAMAYPIFAQQNYPNPREANGRIACANCHLASKPIDVRMPHEVLKDTIFKIAIEVPCKYEKRVQPTADGTKGPLNVGAIAILPEGWKLAPKERLPKSLKKEMKGLSWAPYSKEKTNILVAGPVPGQVYETMNLPVLAPNPDADKNIHFGKEEMYFGGNRGRGQVYPEGNQSNNNQFFASTAGKISAIDGLKITIQKADGTSVTQEVLPGANIVVEVGEEVSKDEPITTNPNVGGFGQEEKEIMLQDLNRIWAYCALAASIFIAQVSFVLKKKQFEKVQMAEGF